MHNYKTLAEIKSDFKEGKPFSIAEFKRNLSYLCYQAKTQSKTIDVYYNKTRFFTAEPHSNTSYQEITLDDFRNKMATFSNAIKSKQPITLTNRGEKLVDCIPVVGYQCLKDLKRALDQGNLETANAVIHLNNTARLHLVDNAENTSQVIEMGCLSDLLKQALDMLGIPWTIDLLEESGMTNREKIFYILGMCKGKPDYLPAVCLALRVNLGSPEFLECSREVVYWVNVTNHLPPNSESK